jgi:iron complex transport system permease protein
MDCGGDAMKKYLTPVLIGLLVISCVIAILVGSTKLTFTNILNGDALTWQIINQLRLPRIIMAILAGVILGITGLLLQMVTRNPLVDSSILGLMNGAQLLTLLVTLIMPHLLGAKVVVSGAFGILVVILWRLIVWKRVNNYVLILSGIALAMTFAALTELIGSGFNANLPSLAVVTWSQVWMIGIFLIIGILVLVAISEHLKFYAVSEVQAKQLGENENKTTWLILLVVGLLIGSVTSVIGVVYFVGVILPQLIQLLQPNQTRLKLFVPTALLGALLLLNADTLARTLFAPRELSATAILLVISGPVFIALVLRRVKNA